MKRTVLTAALAALAAVAVASLASAAPPSGAFGRLVVVNPATHVGSNGNTTIDAIQADNTYRTTVYVPAGYRAPGGLGALNAKVGKATVFVKQPDGSRVTLNGTLTAVDPSQYTTGTCAAATGKHAAVWLLKAQQPNGTASTQFPIYVDDQTTMKDSPYFSYSMQFCAGSTGQNVSEVDLGLVRMFVNPAARGMYLWRAVYAPATSDGKSIQADQSVSVASAVPIAAQVTVRSKRVAGKPGWVTFSGFVTAASHALGNVKVQLFVGHQKRLALSRPRATVRTKADGTYRVTLRLTGKRAWYARAKASTPYQDITAGGGCSVTPGAVPDIATKGCRDATLAPFTVVSNPIKRVG
jgi:hypothetical protein